MVGYKCKTPERGVPMKRAMTTAAAAALCLALLLLFGSTLLRFARPMDGAGYDFSLAWAGEAMPEDWVYDQKGWSVFTMENGERRELAPDGGGGFSGDVRPDGSSTTRARSPRKWTRPPCRSTPTTAPSPSIWTGNASIPTWPRTWHWRSGTH